MLYSELLVLIYLACPQHQGRLTAHWSHLQDCEMLILEGCKKMTEMTREQGEGILHGSAPCSAAAPALHCFTRPFSSLRSHQMGQEGPTGTDSSFFVIPVIKVNKENSRLSLPVEWTSRTCTLRRQFGGGLWCLKCHRT